MSHCVCVSVLSVCLSYIDRLVTHEVLNRIQIQRCV